jgi:hypothetical protein
LNDCLSIFFIKWCIRCLSERLHRCLFQRLFESCGLRETLSFREILEQLDYSLVD